MNNKKPAKSKTMKKNEILNMRINGCLATGRYTGKGRGFVILKGSAISLPMQPSCSACTRGQREKNADKIKDGKLMEDILFTSSSAAASFVAGSPQNGHRFWKKANV